MCRPHARSTDRGVGLLRALARPPRVAPASPAGWPGADGADGADVPTVPTVVRGFWLSP